jgi:hypothetical protein
MGAPLNLVRPGPDTRRLTACAAQELRSEFLHQPVSMIDFLQGLGNAGHINFHGTIDGAVVAEVASH